MIVEMPEIQLYYSYENSKKTREFRGSGVIGEGQVLDVIIKWFADKPVDGRIITRNTVEDLLDLTETGRDLLQIRKEITAICNARFGRYSPDTRSRSWVINGEDLV
ncbi:hypothetical protein [Methanospirillum sp.]